MKISGDMAQRMVRIELPRCLLILTAAEFERAILRGKMEKRREANEKRTKAQGAGSILDAIEEEGPGNATRAHR